MRLFEGVGTSALIRRILGVVLLVSLLVGAGGFYVVLRQRALDDASRQARILLDTAMAVSTFTDTEDFHLIEELPKDRFFKQLVPFFAANAVFRRLQASYPLYTFRQTALNPTNPSDRPTPHEVELTDRFRDDPALAELEGTREDEGRSLFYVARPIKVDDPQCLVCHSTPAAAPAAMVAAYGTSGGFNWRRGDTVGIMELSVPITAELRGATELAAMLAAGLSIVFVLTYVALTSALGIALVTPLRRLADAAEAASLGTAAPDDLPRAGTRELRLLSGALTRLSVSLRKALRQSAVGGPPAGPPSSTP